jgi:hypothetical protein
LDTQINLITDIEETSLNNTFETYAFPSPFSTNLTIRTNLLVYAFVEVKIYSMLGKVIYSNSKHAQPGLVDFIISDGDLKISSRVFIYEVKVNGKSVSKSKIVKE